MDEARLEDALLARHQHVVHDTVAEVGGEHLARLRAVGDEADRPPRPVGVLPQLALQRQQLGLGVDLEGQGVERVALVAAAGAVGRHSSAKEYVHPGRWQGAADTAPLRCVRRRRADHDPPRTARK